MIYRPFSFSFCSLRVRNCEQCGSTSPITINLYDATGELVFSGDAGSNFVPQTAVAIDFQTRLPRAAARPTGDDVLTTIEICNEGNDDVGFYNPRTRIVLFGITFTTEDFGADRFNVDELSGTSSPLTRIPPPGHLHGGRTLLPFVYFLIGRSV